MSDLATGPTATGPSTSPFAHFAIDGMTWPPYLPKLAKDRLGASAIGINGIMWNGIEAAAPIDGVHTYKDVGPLVEDMETAISHGLQVQMNLRPDNDWAIRLGRGSYILPGTGGQHLRWWQILEAHKKDWQDLIRYICETLPLAYLQIGSEPHYQWFGTKGFAEMVRLAYEVVKSTRPEITVMAAGFNFGNRFLYPPRPTSPGMAFVRNFLRDVGGQFDVLSLHMSHNPLSFAPTCDWVREEMAAVGITKPIWAEDMMSGPFYHEPSSTAEEMEFWTLLNEDPPDPEILAEYARRQAATAVIKPCSAFAAGVSRVFLSTDMDWKNYLPELFWRYQGLLTNEGQYKAAYFSYQQLIAAVEYFTLAQGRQQGDVTTTRFTFPDKPPVVVAWADETGWVDISDGMPSNTVRVVPVVTSLDQEGAPVYPPEVEADARSVPVSTIPALVFAA